MTVETYRGYRIEIENDEIEIDPREGEDHLGKMYCFHSGYALGDKHDFSDPQGIESLIGSDAIVSALPLYLMDHSGISMSTSADRFRAVDSAGWDWGQVGCIIAYTDDVLKEYQITEVTPEVRVTVQQLLEAEVEQYDQYLRGDVYYYVTNDSNGNMVDSCSQLYGYDETVRYAKAELDAIIEQCEQKQAVAHVAGI